MSETRWMSRGVRLRPVVESELADLVRLAAIGTADWTPQFVDLLEAADAAAAGLDE